VRSKGIKGEIQMNFEESLRTLLMHSVVVDNPKRESLIEEAVKNREAFASACGALATWTPLESTGRSPKDTLTVRRKESETEIDWDSPNNIPIDEETFDMVLEDALSTFTTKERIYVTDRVLGADSSCALPVKTISDRALTALFTDNMFRKIPEDISRSVFYAHPFTMLVLPYDKLDPQRYKGRLRIDSRLGGTSTMVIGMDYDRRIGIVYGSAYGGSVKKLMFTVMNYLLPAEGILPVRGRQPSPPTRGGPSSVMTSTGGAKKG
jgi:phosphoenolpyruvate carboxykinase (ATP)